MNQPALSGRLSQLAVIATAALEKKAAVDAASLTAGADPAAAGMGMDPAMMAGGGGMPPGGGAPPGPDPMESRLAALESQLAAGGGGGGAAAGVEPIKPKIDVNVEIMKMNKMIARIADALGIQIPASEMVATSADLTNMAQQSSGAAGAAGGAAGAAGGAAGGSAIPPIDPMQGASPAMAGGGGKTAAYDGSGLLQLADRAAALRTLLEAQAVA